MQTGPQPKVIRKTGNSLAQARLGGSDVTISLVSSSTSLHPWYGTMETLGDGQKANNHSTASPLASCSTQNDMSIYRRISATSVHIPSNIKWHEWPLLLSGRGHSPHSNAIHTTKYSLLTFIPKNLFEQFHRFANLYFLLILILSYIPAIQAFGGEVAWIPLAAVLGVTAVKDAFEDYRRYRSDKELNHRRCAVYSKDEGQFVERYWKDVVVGDYIQLDCDEVIPADILLLQSSDREGLCYVQTSNLDGETNLKQRYAPVGVLETASPEDDFSLDQLKGVLFCEQPNNRIYDFRGFIEMSDGAHIAVNRTHMLLRGCVLRNTDSVVGVVVYAGHQTKAMLNNSGPRAKRSKLERAINTEIVSQVIILFILCFLGAVMSGVWTSSRVDQNIVYFPFPSSGFSSPAFEGFLRFWTFVIIFQVIIPISLYVSLEIVKLAQTMFLNWDLDMYYKPLDRPFECRALNINEDLGQIEYVFSDKTGTLTENQMVFRCCTVNGKNYLHTCGSETTANCLDLPTISTGINSDSGYSSVGEETVDYPFSPQEKITLDAQLQQDLAEPDGLDTLHDFFVTLAICNTVVVSKRVQPGKTNKVGRSAKRIQYEAESPDEHALVETAYAYGYILLFRSPVLIKLQTPHHGILEYDVLHILEFSPERKCMSVIVREKNHKGRLMLYSKGADSTIYSNLASDMVLSELAGSGHSRQNEEGLTMADLTLRHVDGYGQLGLRTLCMARRELTEEVYSEWLILYQRAELDLANREELLHQLACRIEKELTLLGATGIEDCLQDGVGETIEALREAGMRIWVLTGDKRETAINIGYSSRLISEHTEVIILQAHSEEQCAEWLDGHLREMRLQDATVESNDGSNNSILSYPIFFFRPIIYKRGTTKPIITLSRALAVDGYTLEFALQPSCRRLFLEIASRCETVICCRATPLQKAAVVQLVKQQLNVMALAIGDGANDVSMIQMADVGVGIAGREGMQAVLASDFNMARFQFLRKLLLVHGHWCYSRLANMMLYFFYKNVMYAVLIFWYQFFNGFSGSNPIDGINLLIFNLVFTSVPIIVVSVADQDLKASTLLQSNGRFYAQGRCSKLYNRYKFWLAMLEAFYQSAVIFFVAFGVYYGSTAAVVDFGFVINIAVVLVANLHLALETLHWTVLNHIALWGSCLMVFVFNLIYCAIDSQQWPMDTLWVLQTLMADLRFWVVQVATPLIALFPRILAKVIHQELFPSPVMAARLTEKKSHRPRSTS